VLCLCRDSVRPRVRGINGGLNLYTGKRNSPPHFSPTLVNVQLDQI
jgi:hypothetical protein